MILLSLRVKLEWERLLSIIAVLLYPKKWQERI